MAKEKTARMSKMGFGLGVGICWAICTFIAGMTAMFGWNIDFVAVMHSAYIGFEPSVVGSIVGAIWAFVHGFIGGVIVAFFYNMFRS